MTRLKTYFFVFSYSFKFHKTTQNIFFKFLYFLNRSKLGETVTCFVQFRVPRNFKQIRNCQPQIRSRRGEGGETFENLANIHQHFPRVYIRVGEGKYFRQTLEKNFFLRKAKCCLCSLAVSANFCLQKYESYFFVPALNVV